MLPLRSLLFTVLIPGTVVVLIPYFIVSRDGTDSSAWTPLQAVSLVPMALGTAILVWCIWDFMAKGRGTLAPIDPPKQLVVQGLYRFVRNPMYLGALLLLLGGAAFFESMPLLQYAIAWFIVINLIVVFREEPVLQRRFGESYQKYRRSVPRWIPTRRPPPPSHTHKPAATHESL
jgi:protein-S-isoprenylcysteine O-methyltransferase Ste14